MSALSSARLQRAIGQTHKAIRHRPDLALALIVRTYNYRGLRTVTYRLDVPSRYPCHTTKSKKKLPEPGRRIPTLPSLKLNQCVHFFSHRYFTPALQLPILKPVPHLPGIRQCKLCKWRHFFAIPLAHIFSHTAINRCHCVDSGFAIRWRIRAANIADV